MFRAGFALVLAVTFGCDKSTDACVRASARLERINKSKGYPALSKATTEQMIESCRTGKYASYDPVLRCAMDSNTDEAAADCIDRGMKDVLEGSAGETGEGSGLNPLLQE